MALFRKKLTTSRVLVRNGTTGPLLVIFEPWCWTTELPPDRELICEATSPRPGMLEVEYTPESVTVYAWDAAVGRVLNAQNELVESFDIPVPDFIGLDQEQARHGRKAAT
jgi:hypothetical protein